MTMTRVSLRLAAAAGAALLIGNLGIAQAADTNAQAKTGGNGGDQIVATVNGANLTARDLASFSRSMASQGQQISREEALQGLVDRELLYQEALAKGYDKLPDVTQELSNQKRMLLSNYAVSEMLRGKQPTEAEMRKVYQDKVASRDIKEYKARHILVDSEADAKNIIAQLDKGGNFSEIAKAKSKDRASAENGGDLGWFNPSQMVPPFSQAVVSLQKGQYTKTPVKTQFGYHVIMLDDSRKVNPPSYEEVKDRLDNVVQSEKIGQHLAELRKKAKIDMKGATAAK